LLSPPAPLDGPGQDNLPPVEAVTPVLTSMQNDLRAMLDDMQVRRVPRTDRALKAHWQEALPL
jgi:hypothetical protein